ncbi:MAG: hypothetical protein GY952_00795 [Rhodobacteraceae bacterium]|nr:hypothetical protein [Paracoccaceae bacterium]
MIQNIRRGSIPSAQKLNAICKALGLEFYIGAPRPGQEEMPGPQPGFAESGTVPLQRFIADDSKGWGRSVAEDRRIARPDHISDPEAFFVRADGATLVPVGVGHGDLCLVTPARPPQPGDIVWVRGVDGRTGIKSLTAMGDTFVDLRGWLPEQDGTQRPYVEQLLRSYVEEVFPVADILTPAAEEDELATIRLHPIQNKVAAEQGGLATIALPLAWFSKRQMLPDDAVLIAVHDDAMQPVLCPGSRVLVDKRQTTAEPGKLFAVRLRREIVVRWLECPNRETLILSCSNPVAPSMILQGSELSEAEILGQVIWFGSEL